MVDRTRSCPYRCWDKVPDRWWMASAWGRRNKRSRWALAGDKHPTPISRRCHTDSCTPSAPLRDPSSWVCRSRSTRARLLRHPRESWRRQCPRVRFPSSLSPSTRAIDLPDLRRSPMTLPATSPSSAAHRLPEAENRNAYDG